MRILIADDSDLVRERLAARIASIPRVTEVAHAADGEMALAAIATGEISVVVLDIHMPLMNGFEVLKELGARECQVPVIVLTENLAYHHYALELGAAYSFDKASEIENVFATIEGLLTTQPGSAV